MKQNQPNLFSQDELDAMVVRKHNKEIRRGIDKNGNPYEVPITKRSKEDFVAKANEVWRGIYDYTDTVLTGMKEPIEVYCPKHDYHFRVAMAQNHIMKHNATGCPVCSYEQQYGEHFGTDWRKYLEPTPGQNRVRRIYRPHLKSNGKYTPLSPEEKAARHAKMVEEQRIRSHHQACSDFRKRLEAKYGDHYTDLELKMFDDGNLVLNVQYQ